MRLEASLQARQEMRLKLAPQIIQSIEILQLPLLELRDRIDQELLENPLLEVGPSVEAGVEGEQAEPAGGDEVLEPVDTNIEVEPEAPEGVDDALEELIRPADVDFYADRIRSSSRGERDAKLAALENSPAPDISLEEHLRRQLAYLEMEADVREVCENIIANLDWHGYLEYPLEEIVASLEHEVDMEKAQAALAIVRTLEPPGVGARDVKECLLLQLDPAGPDYDLLRRLIRDHFEEIARNRYPAVARAAGCTIDRLKEAVEQIAKLNPMPGALFGEEPAPHVVPDLRAELVEGEFRVVLEDASLPSLRVCSYYARRLQRRDLDAKTRDYLRSRLQSARWLIDAIQQRRSTLYNIASAIVAQQSEFLERGPMHLRPLKMQEIADEVKVHVSTVSRAIAGKYMETPQGIFSLKHFFTGGVAKDNGEMESWEVVRQKLLQIIEREDKSDPLSDEQLAEVLSLGGIEIARRTISKYRKVLGIPSSRQRRQY
jgi:RNA polymerase sigma-54 factor